MHKIYKKKKKKKTQKTKTLPGKDINSNTFL